jgi:hypothetical protein
MASSAGEYSFLRAHRNERRLKTAKMIKVFPALGKFSHENPGIVSPV